VSHRPGVGGALKAMRNSAHEANRVWLEPGPLKGVVKTVSMDRKADAQALFGECRRQGGLTLLTWPRPNREHTPRRRARLRRLTWPRSKRR
jgi:hypothetical protein